MRKNIRNDQLNGEDELNQFLYFYLLFFFPHGGGGL